MSWMSGLFTGFFTRHLPTKLLALLLSIGLFGFVQASVTAQQEIARIVLVPTLAEDIRDQHILLTGNFEIKGLTIRGEQSRVEGLSRLYRSSDQRFPIDQRILQTYGKSQKDGTFEIQIDANLLRDDVLFGKDVTVERLESVRSVLIAPREERTAQVVVAQRLQNYTHDDYEGRLSLVPNFQSVTIRGPKNAFEKEAVRVVVNVKNIGDLISAQQIQEDTGTLTFGGAACEIQWKDGDINPNLVPFLTIVTDGGESLPASVFRQRLEISCTATKRKDTIQVDQVPIVIRDPVPRKFDLLEKYSVSVPFTQAEIELGHARLLKVKLPASMRDDGAFLKNLVLVLNVAAAWDKTGEIVGRDLAQLDTTIDVPFYLDLKDQSRADDLKNLRQVSIVTEEAQVARFVRK